MRKAVLILDSFLVILITLLLCSVFVLTGLGSKYPQINRFASVYFYPTLFLILAFQAVMFIVTIVFMVMGLTNSRHFPADRVYKLARAQMVMRLIQVPFYVMIFIIALICLITIFTFAVSIVLAVLDLISIITTGMCSVAVYYQMRTKGMITLKEQVIYSILGFVYCADVAVAIAAFARARSAKRSRDMDGNICYPVRRDDY